MYWWFLLSVASYYLQYIERSSNRTAYSYLDDFNTTVRFILISISPLKKIFFSSLQTGDEMKSTLSIPLDVLELMADKKVFSVITAVPVNFGQWKSSKCSHLFISHDWLRVCNFHFSCSFWLNFQVLLGAAAITISDIYEKEVNYTYPISVQIYTMLISRPKELSRLYLFTAPFTIDVSFLTEILCTHFQLCFQFVLLHVRRGFVSR